MKHCYYERLTRHPDTGKIVTLQIQRSDIPQHCRVFDYLSTPGHGYLKVPNALLAKLGIARDISAYSYQSRFVTSLEEDCDMGIFLRTYIAQFDRCVIRSCHVDRANTGMSHYHPSFVETPIKVGARYTVDGITRTLSNLAPPYATITIQSASRPPLSYRIASRNVLTELKPTHVPGIVVYHPQKGILIGTRSVSPHQDQPIWSARAPAETLAPTAALYNSINHANTSLAKVLGDDRVHCEFREVQTDPWIFGDRAAQDVIVRAGLPSWSFSAHFERLDFEYIYLKYRGKQTIYMHSTHLPDNVKGQILEHRIVLPGRFIQVTQIIADTLPARLQSRLTTDGQSLYLPETCRFDYIDALDQQGYVYAKYGSYSRNPCWYDQLSPVSTVPPPRVLQNLAAMA